jgi:trans-L-3-hydroxyproline dehydratase
MHESIVGTRFSGRVVGDSQVGEIPSVITEVEGSAHFTGTHQFALMGDDPIGPGFLLR